MTTSADHNYIFSRLPALRHRDYRLFFFGQCISLIGTWMQTIGQSWLVLELTHSALKLSLVSAVQFLPLMLLSLYAGTLVDRFPKRHLLIFTQTSLAVLAAILGSLTYFQVVQYWHILILASLLGLVNTLDIPTRQSFFIELVGKSDLMNAIGLNSSIFNLARIVGPALAGFLIGIFGIAICFYLNALSYLAVITGLWLIQTRSEGMADKAGSFSDLFQDVRQGLSYIGSVKLIRLPLILLALISTFVMNQNVLIPVLAQQDLGQNAAGYGLLMTAMGIGSFTGAIVIAVRSQAGPSLKYLLGGALGLSFFTLILGFENQYVLVCITLLIMGFCMTLFTALVNSMVQLNSADHMRGRVMSVFSLVFLGVTPIGSLIAGNIAEYAGVQNCLIISGIVGIMAVCYTAWLMRDVYAESRSPLKGEA